MFGLVLALLFGLDGPLYDDPAADRLVRQAMQTTYDLQLDEARGFARTLESRFPDHPAGFTLYAETYWWEAMMDPTNQAVEDAYERAQKIAVQKGESALNAGKYPKLEVTAYLASSHGSRARFLVTQRGVSWGAMRAGMKAHGYAEKVFAMDKFYYDIYVGIGAYNYFAGSLPAVIKPFAWLLGARGDKDLGFEQLRTAIEKARYAQTEARIVYYTALLEDKQYAEAFRVIEKLKSDYKDNFVLYIWVTDWFRRQRKNREGADYFERVFQDQIQRSPLMAKYALFEKAQLQTAHSRKADARRTLERIQAIPGTERLLQKKLEAFRKTL